MALCSAAGAVPERDSVEEPPGFCKTAMVWPREGGPGAVGALVNWLAANGAAAFDYNYEAAEPRFENVSLEAGVEHIYGGSWEHYTGGGVAAFDCDRDGDADLDKAAADAVTYSLYNAG